MCVAVVGPSVLVATAGRRWSPRFRQLSPIQALALASASVLGLLLNANAWLPGYLVFYALLLLGVGGIALALRRAFTDPLAHAAIWSIAIGVLAGTFVVACWDLIFAARHLWLLEGTNHDLVFFYGGAKWAMEHSLAVSQATIANQWGLGECGQGMHFIGNGCIVQRNGTYTLLALASSLTPQASPNGVRAMIGSAALFPVLGMLPTMAGKFGGASRWPRGSALALLLAVVVMLATPMMLSVVNENIGTAMAATLLMMIMLWALTPMRSPTGKWIMLGMAAGCVGLVYGEAAVYACLVVGLSVATTALRMRSWRMFLVGGVFASSTFMLSLNRMLPELLSSYVQVSDIVSSATWPSWYIQQENAIWWLAAPFAALLMTVEPAVNFEAAALGIVLMSASAWLSIREKRWAFYIGFLAVSALLVAYVQIRGYQYGEHKLIEILGPAWIALLAWLLLRHASRAGRLPLVFVLMSMLGVLSVAFVLRVRPVIVSHVPSAITHSFAEALGRVAPGDEVVMDVSGVSGPERYVKQDFAFLELAKRGIRVLMADNGRHQEAYSDALLGSSFTLASSPDWLLVLKQPGSAPDLSIAGAPVMEDPTYALFSLRSAGLPLVQTGRGWHTCEPDHCWTEGSFSFEAFVPSGCNGAHLRFDIGVLQPPSDGKISISVNGRQKAELVASQAKEISLELVQGRSLVTVAPSWEVTSPLALGLSADGRRLFASIARARVSCNVEPNSRDGANPETVVAARSLMAG